LLIIPLLRFHYDALDIDDDRLLSTSSSCLKMTVSVLCAGLGLGASSTGRRDSFDRNTSAFSPSLEYSRAKWPQSYGALGKDRLLYPVCACATQSVVKRGCEISQSAA